MKREMLILLGLLTVITCSVSAELAVDFSATTTPDENAYCEGRSRGNKSIIFSTTIPHNPDRVKYPEYDGKSSPVFYSGAEADQLVGEPTQFNQYRVDDKYDEITVVMRVNGFGAGEKAAIVHLWQKADFLNGLDAAESLTLSATDAFSATLRNYTTVPTLYVRWVIREGDSYYISAAEKGINTKRYKTLTLVDPAAVTWYNYDPASTVLGIGSAATPTFANITALGIYTVFENNDDSQAVLGLQSFSANATN